MGSINAKLSIDGKPFKFNGQAFRDHSYGKYLQLVALLWRLKTHWCMSARTNQIYIRRIKARLEIDAQIHFSHALSGGWNNGIHWRD